MIFENLRASRLFLGFCFFCTNIIWSPSALAAKVLSCRPKLLECELRVEDGRINDKVTILTEGARTAAYGKIIKRNGNRATIKITEFFEDIVPGSAASVETDNDRSSVQQTAPFSYKEK